MKATYSFTYQTGDTRVVHSVDLSDEDPWSEVLTRFVDFLTGVYGYRPEVYYHGGPELPIEDFEDGVE